MPSTWSKLWANLAGGAVAVGIIAAGLFFGKSRWQTNAELNQMRRDMDAQTRRAVADFPRQYRAGLEERRAALLKDLQNPDAQKRAAAAGGSPTLAAGVPPGGTPVAAPSPLTAH